MRALVHTGPFAVELQDRALPRPGPGEVRLRVMAVAICGSDAHGYTGSTGRRIPPVVMGHEASGVIDAIGQGVEGWEPGARVTFDSIAWCGSCAPWTRVIADVFDIDIPTSGPAFDTLSRIAGNATA